MNATFMQRREANRQSGFLKEGTGYLVDIVNPKELNEIFGTHFNEAEYYELDNGEKKSSNVVAILADKPGLQLNKDLKLSDLTLVWIPGGHNKENTHTWGFNAFLNPDGEHALTYEELGMKLHFYRGEYTYHPILRDDNGDVVKDEKGNAKRSQVGETNPKYLIVEVTE